MCKVKTDKTNTKIVNPKGGKLLSAVIFSAHTLGPNVRIDTQLKINDLYNKKRIIL